MNNFFSHLFTRYPIKSRRTLEFLPGFLAWMIILFPLWGALVIPTIVAYFILFFDLYWCYKSFALVVTASIASKRIKEAEKIDWYARAKEHADVHKVHHVIVIPNYKEKADKIRLTLEAMAQQSLPPKQLHIVLAME